MKPHVVTIPATPRKLEIPTRVSYEDAVIADAEKNGYFTATIKVGRGEYHTVKALDQEDARRYAEQLCALYPKDKKHAMVYAVTDVHQVFVGSWVPGEGWRDRRL